MCRAAVLQSDDFDLYAASRTKEFNGLLDHGVFTLLNMSDADGYRICSSRFFDEIKHMCTLETFTKSRFVIMEFNDKEHGLLTRAPPVQ